MKNLFNAFRPLLVDFLSTIFFVAFYVITHSVRAAVILGIAAGAGHIGFLLAARRPVAALQWVSLLLVITMGGATLVTDDPRFVMVKPSIATFAAGLVMLRSNWMVRYLPEIVRENVPPSVPLLWGYCWAALMFVLAAANLAVAMLAGFAAWAWFASIVPLAAQGLLFIVQYVNLSMLVRRNIAARRTA